MWHRCWGDASFHELLVQIDAELAGRTQVTGCPHCGGVLHRSNYPRKPFGVAAAYRDAYGSRLSFCCADCRRRTTPPSVRFFGRWRFAAWAMLLITMLQRGPNEKRCAQLSRLGLTVSASTWQRWRRWWRECFAGTPFWQARCGRVVMRPDPRPWPAPLLPCAPLRTRSLYGLLAFLAPLTGGAERAV